MVDSHFRPLPEKTEIVSDRCQMCRALFQRSRLVSYRLHIANSSDLSITSGLHYICIIVGHQLDARDEALLIKCTELNTSVNGLFPSEV